MRQMQPVLWTKGILLSPQHLQTQDRFLEDLLGFQLSTLVFSPWGFSRLELDHEALAGGEFAVGSAAGILPDGLLFDIPNAEPAPAPKRLEGYWDPDQQTLDVYLTIPEYRPGGLNISATQKERNTRYLAEVVMRRDENTGLAEKPVQVARKNFRLLVEGESLEGSSALRVARLTRSPTGEYQLDPQFVPPLIDIGASDYIMSIARRLVELLAAKGSTLSETRRQRSQGLADFGISDVANFWLLYTVNAYLPQLRHIFETRRGHPGQLYSLMLSLAGSLTAFSTRIQPRDLPSYDHSDLSGCFTDLDVKLRELLDTVVPSNYVSLPMRLVEAAVYATAVDQERYLEAQQCYLALKAGLKREELVKKATQLIKISSADHIDRLIKQALPGLALVHTPGPPGAIPVKLDYQYFRLTLSGPEWDAIRQARNAAAYVPADFPDPQLELVLVLPPPKTQR
jgi:type VI secretion system protein ImpJ